MIPLHHRRTGTKNPENDFASTMEALEKRAQKRAREFVTLVHATLFMAQYAYDNAFEFFSHEDREALRRFSESWKGFLEHNYALSAEYFLAIDTAHGDLALPNDVALPPHLCEHFYNRLPLEEYNQCLVTVIKNQGLTPADEQQLRGNLDTLRMFCTNGKISLAPTKDTR